ncbi:hypothetical protein HMPREF1248_0052 [Coriobacteriaceae bacterium BV3Ac1]|nr:hypothetical protein HMPREF1248_0052 [Coriobacteriaceae bacterium BV3Ac1]
MSKNEENSTLLRVVTIADAQDFIPFPELAAGTLGSCGV